MTPETIIALRSHRARCGRFGATLSIGDLSTVASGHDA
jgi:hypothetical protein